MGLTVGELCNRDVIMTSEGESLRQAARRMRKHHVGDLVVVDTHAVPVGILTDRDLVVGAVVASEDEDLDAALQRMRSKAIRRLPVVTAEGDLMGILTIDDVLRVLNEELSELVRLVMREQLRETADRRPL